MHNRHSVSLALCALLSLFPLAAQEAALDPLPKGAVSLFGYYSPKKLELSSAKPKGIKKVPSLVSPLYGVLPIKGDGKTFHVAIGGGKDAASVLYVDANGNGDLTDDPPTEWKARKDSSGYSTYMGTAAVELGSGKDAFQSSIGVYRFDPADPSRAAYKAALLYYRDYAYSGTAAIGADTYRIALSDENVSGDFSAEGVLLFIDRDGNGTFDPKWERFDAQRPFALNGVAYQISGMAPLGGRFSFARSSATVAEIPPPPDLRKGKKIVAFKATDLNGKSLSFPSDYAGKVVLLDFWATWCGPCLEELPGLVSAYASYSGKGFDVLGVSLDSAGQETKLRSFLKERGMPWRQVYDGGGWKAAVAVLYSIDGIPAPFLVDGDSGEILELGDELRGPSLKAALEKALAAKKKTP